MKEIEVEELQREPDPSDQATRIEMASTQESIDKVLRSREPVPSDFDGKHCVDCGEDIPEARLKHGCFRDLYCQNKHESAQKHRRKL